MKVVEHVEYQGWGSFYHPTVTQVFPYLGPEDDETQPIRADDDENADPDMLPGCLCVDEITGKVIFEFDLEWLWEPNAWSLDMLEKFAGGVNKALEIGRTIEAQDLCATCRQPIPGGDERRIDLAAGWSYHANCKSRLPIEHMKAARGS